MSRHQTGHIFESTSGRFYVRYYDTEIVDGKPRRVQKSQFLCRKDDKHFSRTCKGVKLLRDDFMRSINGSQATGGDMPVTDFWDNVYIPWAKEINPKVGEPNLRASTLEGYEQIWAQHLKEHF